MRIDPTPGRRHARSRVAFSSLLIVVVGAVAFAAFRTGPAGAQAQAAPSNSAEPVVSGNAIAGSTLTGTDGSWNNSPTSFAYQWVRCPSSGGAADGSDCATISGATTSSYIVGAGDVGSTLRLRVTASNSDGSQTAASNATAVVSSSAPVNTAAPAVTGSPVQGQTLTGTNGTWTGATPIGYAYQWVHCPSDGGAADGSNCTNIASATSTSYTLQSSDVGSRIRLRVTASNSGGSQTAASNATDTVTATATGLPTNTTQPVISGGAQQGSQLVASVGTWTGSAPISYATQWVRCGTDGGNADASNCTTIAAATTATYLVQSADVGARLRVRVTATNSAGSRTAASNATAVVQGPSTQPPPASGVVPIASVVAPQRLVIDRVQFTPNPVRSRQSTIQLRVHISDTLGHGVSGALVFARTTPILTTTPPEQATGPDGWATLTLIPRPDFPLQGGHSVQVFIRTRKAGEPILTGVSNRRLVQVATRR